MGSFVLAGNIEVDIANGSNATINDLFKNGQTFHPTQNNISGISFDVRTGSTDGITFDIRLCKGDNVGYTTSGVWNCGGSGLELIWSAIATSTPEGESDVHKQNFMFATPVAVDVGADYYWTVHWSNTFVFSITNGSVYSEGHCMFYDSDCGGDGGAYDILSSVWYRENWTPNYNYYVSNDTTGSAIDYTNGSTAKEVYTVTTYIGKTHNDDTGQAGMAVWDNENNVYIATSTLYSMSNFIYDASPGSNLVADRFDFYSGVPMEANHTYQFQIWVLGADAGAGLFFNATSTNTGLPIYTRTPPTYTEFTTATSDYAKLLDFTIEEYYTVHTDIGTFSGESPQLGVSNFTFPTLINCEIATSCPFMVQYSFDDVGADLYMLEENAESLSEYTNLITDLESKPLLEEEMLPTIQYAPTSINYRYYIDRDAINASSSLYSFTKVNWVTELTDEHESSNFLSFFWSKIKNIFPLSIYFQVKATADAITSNSFNQGASTISFQDLVSSDYKNLIATTTIILDSDGLNDTLPLWTTHIYPAIEMLIYLMNLIFIIFLILPGKQSAGTDGV